MGNQLQQRWVRWLVSQGLPPDHVARVLEIDPAEVEVLAPWSGRGVALRVDGPPRRHWREMIAAQTATKIRRLDELGYDPGRIAAILAIRRADVVDFLARSKPLRTPKNGTPVLTRPRDRSEHRQAMATIRRRQRRRPPAEPPDEWGYRHVYACAEIADQTTPAPIVPAIVAVEVPELVAVEARADVQAGAELPLAGEWEPHFGRRDRRGSHHQRSVLDFALAQEIRKVWAAGGITQRELAARYYISLSTLKRVLSGQSYAEPDTPPAAAELPATSPSPPPPKRRTTKPRARGTVQQDWDYRDNG
jgi:hypothetical protein